MSSKLNPKTKFIINPASHKSANRTVLDFWQWAYSDLTQNITRGVLAEYLVAWAICKDDEARDPWQSYDLINAKGKRIEVKSTADAQSWTYGNRPPQFTIKPTYGYDKHTGYNKEIKLQADIYVLAHLMGKDIRKVNPLDTNQWQFWILAKKELVGILNGRQSISVSNLKKIRESVHFDELAVINDM